MRDHFRRCTRKGIVDPRKRQEKIYCKGCLDRCEKDEDYGQQMRKHDSIKAAPCVTLTVKIVKELEQQRIAGGNHEQQKQQAHPIFFVVVSR